MIQEVVFMLERDVELFIEHYELKGLSQKTIGSYEQTIYANIVDARTQQSSILTHL